MTEAAIWKNRIVGYASVPPSQLVENELNWRTHSDEQTSVLEAMLTEIGYVQNVIVNLTTTSYELVGEEEADAIPLIRTDGPVPVTEHIHLLEPHLVDGHLRRNTAIAHNQPTIPVTFVDLTLEEEQSILATLDPIGAMARIDGQRLRALHENLRLTGEAVQTFLADIADAAGLYVQTFTPAETDAAYVENPYETREYYARKQVSMMFSMEDFAQFTAAVNQLQKHYATSSMTETVLLALVDAAATIPEPKVGPAREKKAKAEKVPLLKVPAMKILAVGESAPYIE